MSATDHRTDEQSVLLIDGLYICAAIFAATLALFFIVALLTPAKARSADPPPFPNVTWLYANAELQAENDRLRTKVRKLKKANRYHGRLVRRLQGELQKVSSPVWYALKLAATTFGVPFWELHSVGSCESGLWPYAQNSAYRGLFQEGPMFERGPFGRAGFSVWDPVANAMTAAYTVHQQGWRQWSCKP